MSDQAWRFIALLGGLMVAGALYLGLSSLSVAALNGTEDCGSASFASNYATNGTGSLIVAECDSKRHGRQQLAVGVGIAGLVIGGYALSQSTLAYFIPAFGRRHEGDADQ